MEWKIKMKPKYKHNSTNDEFLGHFHNLDFYFCPAWKGTKGKLSLKEHYLIRISSKPDHFLTQVDDLDALGILEGFYCSTDKIRKLTIGIQLFALEFATNILKEKN